MRKKIDHETVIQKVEITLGEKNKEPSVIIRLFPQTQTAELVTPLGSNNPETRSRHTIEQVLKALEKIKLDRED